MDSHRWEPGPRVEGSGGVEIATWDLGGEGPPLLLTHGTGFHAKTWLPVAPVLCRRFRVWAVDQRGQGASGHVPADDYRDWSPFADDLLAVVDALGLGGEASGVFGAGHSLGAATLILAEQRRPGTFEALYCYEPIVLSPELRSGVTNEQFTIAATARKRRPTFASLDAARANFAGKPPFVRFRPDALDAYVSHAFVPQPDGSVTLACAPEEEAAIYEGSLFSDSWERLPVTDLPVTVAGGADEDGPGIYVPMIAERLKRGKAEHWPALDHFGPMEEPAAIGEAIVAALDPDVS